ncbi:MAG: hypothetical protein M0Z61_02830 [Nitrospiraceae bacterium]|nr:hypothetical protein [Nitrospiraceae bacterium]
MKHKFFLAALILAVAVFLGCSANRFTLYKDGRDYYFGTRQVDKMLCASGDLKEVLARSSVPSNLKKDFYRYNCVEPNSDKVQGLYALLSPDEKENLQLAFEAQGYEINRSPCS